MSEAAAVVWRLNQAVNAHDVPGARRQLAEDARVQLASGRSVDVDGYARFLQVSLVAFPDLEVEIRRCVTDDEVVVVEEVFRGTHRGEFAGLAPTGRSVALPMVHVARVEGERIVELVAYHDTAGVLRQLRD